MSAKWIRYPITGDLASAAEELRHSFDSREYVPVVANPLLQISDLSVEGFHWR